MFGIGVGEVLVIVIVMFFVFGVPLAIVGILAYVALNRRMHQTKTGTSDDARTIQELSRIAHRLEERMEALETLMLDGERQHAHRQAAHAEKYADDSSSNALNYIDPILCIELAPSCVNVRNIFHHEAHEWREEGGFRNDTI